MRHPFTVPLFCPACRQPMTAEFELDRKLALSPPTRLRIVCPRKGCTGVIEPTMHGTVVSIWVGHGPKPDPT